MSFCFHRLDQNTTEKFDKFCPTHSRAEFVKFFGGILVQTMKAKEHFEINWPLFFRNNIQFKLLKNVCIQISPRKSSKTLRVAQTLFLRNAPVKYVGNQNSMKCTLTSADHFRETAALEKHHGQQTNTRCWILIKGFQQAPSQILNFKPAKQKYSWVWVRWSFF